MMQLLLNTPEGSTHWIEEKQKRGAFCVPTIWAIRDAFKNDTEIARGNGQTSSLKFIQKHRPFRYAHRKRIDIVSII